MGQRRLEHFVSLGWRVEPFQKRLHFVVESLGCWSLEVNSLTAYGTGTGSPMVREVDFIRI